jgi:hypothetical protein
VSDPVVVVSGDDVIVEVAAAPEILVVEAPYTLPSILPSGGGIFEGESLDDAGPEWVAPFFWRQPSTGGLFLVIDAPGEGGFADLFSDLFAD